MNSDEILKQQLSTWKLDVEIPSRFQSDVWTQIAARESSRRSLWDQLSDWFATEFCTPRFAGAMMALSLMIGVGAAFLKAQDSSAMVGRQQEARYMESINPLAHGGLASS